MTTNAQDEFGGQYRDESLSCPDCHEVSPIKEWADCEVGCEDCGTHDGVMCPRCEERFDHVWGYDKIEDENAKRKAKRKRA